MIDFKIFSWGIGWHPNFKVPVWLLGLLWARYRLVALFSHPSVDSGLENPVIHSARLNFGSSHENHNPSRLSCIQFCFAKKFANFLHHTHDLSCSQDQSNYTLLLVKISSHGLPFANWGFQPTRMKLSTKSTYWFLTVTNYDYDHKP